MKGFLRNIFVLLMGVFVGGNAQQCFAATITINESNKASYSSITVNVGDTYVVSAGTSLSLSSLSFNEQYEEPHTGTFRIEEDAEVTYTSSSAITIRGRIDNYGTFYIGSNDVTIDCGYNVGKNYPFNNYGTVVLTATATTPRKKVILKSDNADKLNLKNGKLFRTNNYDVEMQTNYNAIYLGNFYVADGNMTINMQSGYSTNAEELIVDGTLTLQNGVQRLNVNKAAFLDIINTSTWNQFDVEVAEGANLYVKNIDRTKEIQFTLTKNSSFTLCNNPSKSSSPNSPLADYGGGKYLVTMGSASTFNYIIDQYKYGNSEYQPTNKTVGGISGESDVNAGNYTVELQRYGRTVDEGSGIRITSFIQFIRYIMSLFSTREEQKVYLNGAFADIEECTDAYDNHKSELLPIELVSFNFNKTKNEFVWTTASETNNDYFVVEYSKNGKDWVECTERVASLSTTGYTYSTEPSMPINESLFSYFRLKQVDLNGEYSYSDVIAVSFTVENPCSEEFSNNKIQIRELGNKWFRLINGELIYCENDNGIGN